MKHSLYREKFRSGIAVAAPNETGAVSYSFVCLARQMWLRPFSYRRKFKQTHISIGLTESPKASQKRLLCRR
jgi:hypothetical protein